MRSPQRRSQAGFTIVELIVALAITAVLASIAIAQMRDFTRRAKITELVTAVSKCRTAVSENYLTLERAPEAGTWGCESATPMSPYSGALQTSVDGAVRVSIANLDGLVNGQYVYLVPMHDDGSTPMNTTADLGRPVRQWACGSDWLPVRNSLPSTCQADTTAIAASSDFN
jgi:type IV pilus assembly protein PilA